MMDLGRKRTDGLAPECLKRSASWMRDELDPMEPSSLKPSLTLTIHNWSDAGSRNFW
jgi:hypothetical protein